jgi:hypothetical protein
MLRVHGFPRRSWLALAVVALTLTTFATAAPRQKKAKPGEYNSADRSVEMFQAIESGDIEVKVIPKDSTQCRVLITNKTDKPLNVKLPETFAAVPVLAQFGGGGVGGMGGPGGGGGLGGGGNVGGGGGGSQGMGGGMGGMGGMGMGGMGGGMFNVAPEKVGDLTATTVCLEHGKDEPKPKIPYAIKPIDSLTDKHEVHELCRMLGAGQLDQRAAQAAAWHLNNGMSWEELSAKRIRYANGSSRPYFSPQELRVAVEITSTAVNEAKQRETASPGKDDSHSRR